MMTLSGLGREVSRRHRDRFDIPVGPGHFEWHFNYDDILSFRGAAAATAASHKARQAHLRRLYSVSLKQCQVKGHRGWSD